MNNGPAIGKWFLGAIAVVAIADTKAAPIVAAFLTAAVIYNASPLLSRLTGEGQSSGVTPVPFPATGPRPPGVQGPVLP